MGKVPVGPIAGALVGLMVVVVAALALVLMVVLMLRKRQKKIPHEVDAQERTPTYRGSVYLLSSHHQTLTNRLCTRVHRWVGG